MLQCYVCTYVVSEAATCEKGWWSSTFSLHMCGRCAAAAGVIVSACSECSMAVMLCCHSHDYYSNIIICITQRIA